MKTVKILMISLLAVAMLSGCKKDDDPEPTTYATPKITLDPKTSDLNFDVTDEVSFYVKLEAEAKIKSLTIQERKTYKNGTISEFEEIDMPSNWEIVDKTEAINQFKKTYSIADELSKIEIRFTVFDTQDKFGIETYTVTVIEPVVTTELTNWSADIKMGMTGQTKFDNDAGKPYGFYYHTQTGSEIELTSHNSAKFIIVTSAEAEGFETYESIVNYYSENKSHEKTEVMVPMSYYEGGKAYSQRSFISFVNNEYYLIKTQAAEVRTATGNFVTFQVKEKKSE